MGRNLYVRRNGRLVNKSTGEPLLSEEDRQREVAAPRIVADLKPYRSPITGQMIEGRAARREELERHDCRELDPSEYSPEYRRPHLERKYSKRGREMIRAGAKP